MNQNTACGYDQSHHRNHFGPAVLAALCILDRVEDGQDVPAADVQLALEVTGDAPRADTALPVYPRGRGYRLWTAKEQRP